MIFVKNKKPDDYSVFNALTATSLFTGLSEQELMPLIKTHSYIQFNEGDILNNEGAIFKQCPIVLSGQVEVLRYTYDGNEKVFGIFNPYEIVAIAAVFMSHHRYPMTLRAKVKGDALLLEQKELIILSENNSKVARRLLDRFSKKLYEYINTIDLLTSSSSEQRLASYLLELCYKQETTQIIIPLTRNQLAAKLGIRYETLSRLFSNWRKNKIVEVLKDKLIILQSLYLENIAAPGKRDF